MRSYQKYIEGLNNRGIRYKYYVDIKKEYGPEKWKWLDDIHQISNYGRARKLLPDGSFKLLLPSVNSSKYLTLRINGVSHSTSRWAMEVWSHIPEGDIDVHHIDENQYNNHISNLTCKTPKEHHDLHPHRKWNRIKRKVELYKVSNNEVVRSFNSITEAKHFWGCSSSAIDRYINDKMPCKGYSFRYAD